MGDFAGRVTLLIESQVRRKQQACAGTLPTPSLEMCMAPSRVRTHAHMRAHS